jgi:hypothetical protein
MSRAAVSPIFVTGLPDRTPLEHAAFVGERLELPVSHQRRPQWNRDQGGADEDSGSQRRNGDRNGDGLVPSASP